MPDESNAVRGEEPSTGLWYAISALILTFGAAFSGGVVSTLMSVGGWLGDRFGRIRMFRFAVLLFGAFTLLVSIAQSWHLLVLFRLIAGMGVGASMVLGAVYVSEIWGWMPKGRAIALGILAVGFPIGIIGSGLVTQFTMEWREAFLAGILPVLIAIVCFFVLMETEQWKSFSGRSKMDPDAENSPPHGLMQGVNRRNILIGSVVFGSMLTGIWSTFSWLPTWAQNLVADTGQGIQAGGTLIMLLGMGGILGSFISGFLANGIGRKRALMIAFGGAAVAATMLYVTNQELSGMVYAQTVFLAIFFGISQGILTVYIPELFPVSIRSTATGISFNAGRVITATAVFFVGILVPVLGGYGNSLLFFSVTYLIGFVTVIFGRETKGTIL